jgi:hypothetical protein
MLSEKRGKKPSSESVVFYAVQSFKTPLTDSSFQGSKKL